MIDYFVAALKCPRCGKTSPVDASTNMSTRLRLEADGSLFGVGDRFTVGATDAEDAGYLAVAPADGGELRLLESWECPFCGGMNWAEVTVRDGKIAAIAAVRLTKEALARASFISDQCDFVAAELMGRPSVDLIREGVDRVGVLRERLP
jgi:hypothetical protein